jgi:hypothetical protein
MNWLCWHVGTVTDGRIRLAARRANQPTIAAVALWAAIVEDAGDHDGRFEPKRAWVAGASVEMDEEIANAIVAEFLSIGLLAADGTLVGRAVLPPNRSRLPEHIWAAIRTFVFGRDNHTCQYCGARGVKLECDHIVPVALGGSHALTNLATACFDCNRSKGSMLLADWLELKGRS